MSMQFNENWDGIPRRNGELSEAVNPKRDYRRAAQSLIDHVRNKSSYLHGEIKGRKVHLLMTSWSYEVNASKKYMATDEKWYGFCPLDDGTVIHFITNFSSRHNYALWGSITAATMSKEDARRNYLKIKGDKEFEWEGDIKA